MSPVLLPDAAIMGKHGVGFAVSSTHGPSLALVRQLGSSSKGQTPFLMRETSHKGDLLAFFVSGEDFSSTYTVDRKIGEGGFGKVFEARHKSLGLARAVKRMKKTDESCKQSSDEIAALLALDHPHIVRLVEYFDEDQYLYLVFELCTGPDLLDRINKEKTGRLSEHDASVASRHMLKALQCCHSHYRGHYDIKPENFMYSSKDLLSLKMIDLGMSSHFTLRNHPKGTPLYMAPEFWNGVYGPEGDVWSCGVVLFIMLTGEAFLPDIAPEMLKYEIKVRRQMQERLKWAADTCALSTLALSILGGMLQHDRHARPTVREALFHPFHRASYDTERLDVDRTRTSVFEEAIAVRERLPELFRAYAAEPMIKKAARFVMAHFGDSSEAERLAFRMLDQRGYGEVSISVLENDFILRAAAIPDDLEELFEAIDQNRDGYIGYLTFMAATLRHTMTSDANLCRIAFRILDHGKDGLVDGADIAAVFGHTDDHEACRGLAEVDPDGQVSLDRFLELMGCTDAGQAWR